MKVVPLPKNAPPMLVVELEGGITPYIASWNFVINTGLTDSYSRRY